MNDISVLKEKIITSIENKDEPIKVMLVKP